MDGVTGPHTWTGKDLTVLVPTYKRPAKLGELLDSILAQTDSVRRVVVVDGGGDARDVCEAYAGRLRVDYFVCEPPGQIRQRNHGLAQLDGNDRLVALLDDDIVMEPYAVNEMIALWNRAPVETVGVAFNIINGDPEKYTVLKGLLGICAKEPGRVLRNGMTSAISHAREDTQVQWLPGGATVWRSDVLLSRPHREVSARWAIAEDLVFSYPLGQQFPMFVCASAEVHHLHISDYGRARADRYHGKVQTLWTYHFVATNPRLSRLFFFYTLGARLLGKVLRGVFRLSRADLEFAVGQAIAVSQIADGALTGKASFELLAEDDS
ncbi:MAG: glycosyltransferase [Longimicrobiales bacterium]|jgi:glycosyltransferase involved in cell wall biosynthesis|nr:glycosyltransferase [Longimicrobiales bacterium]